MPRVLIAFVLLAGLAAGATGARAGSHNVDGGAAARTAADYSAWRARQVGADERAAQEYAALQAERLRKARWAAWAYNAFREPRSAKPHIYKKKKKVSKRLRKGRRYAALRAIPPSQKANRVVVLKSERRMALMRGDRVLKVYRIALGRYAKGAKRQRGDAKTPEGVYTLDYVLKKSSFYRALHINYPSARDTAWARARGVRPGGDIVIHGIANYWTANEIGHPKLDWTQGCIAVDNHEMDEIIATVQLPAQIEIHP